MSKPTKKTSHRKVLLLFIFLVLGAILLASKPLMRYRISGAVTELDQGRPQVAVETLSKLERLYPKSGQISFLLARAHRKLGQLTRATEYLNRAAQLGYSVEVLELEQLLMQAQIGRVNEVEPQLRQHLQESTKDQREVCEALVNGYLVNYRFNDAAEWLAAWEADLPSDPLPHIARGKMLEHLQLWGEASESYQSAVSLAPHRLDARLLLAFTLIRLHRHDDALILCEQCLAVEPNDLQALRGAAICHLNVGEADVAREKFNQMLEFDPDNLDALSGLGQLLVDDGESEPAISLLTKVVASRSTDLAARNALANALSSVGRKEDAVEHVNFVNDANVALTRIDQLMLNVQANPDLVQPRYEIGVTLLKYASPAEGVAWLTSVLQLQPTHAGSHSALAAHYESSGNDRLASYHRQQSRKAPSAESN